MVPSERNTTAVARDLIHGKSLCVLNETLISIQKINKNQFNMYFQYIHVHVTGTLYTSWVKGRGQWRPVMIDYSSCGCLRSKNWEHGTLGVIEGQTSGW